jgi:hypothetical protein
MKKEITPADSVVPVYLEPIDNKQVAADNIEKARLAAEAKAKADAKTAAQAKLAALGLTLEDLQALGL